MQGVEERKYGDEGGDKQDGFCFNCHCQWCKWCAACAVTLFLRRKNPVDGGLAGNKNRPVRLNYFAKPL
jgi:hypothetical protein